jgi:sporulation protein YlmC with PRC-barrel domain
MFFVHQTRGLFSTLILVIGLAFLLVPSSALAQEAAVFATTLLDQNIEDAQGEKIGEVDDLVIKRSGRVKKITLEVGGFMDIGDKVVAVSYNDFGIEANGNITLDTSVEQLNKKEEFDYYRKGFQPEYYYSLRSQRMRGYPPAPGYRTGRRSEAPRPGYYYGRNYPYARNAYPPPEYDTRQPRPYIGSLYYDWAISPARFLASSIVNRGLVTEQGTDLGYVEDLLIDVDKKVEKIIVASEDYLGEEVYAAIDYDPIKYNPYGIVLDMSLEEFENLPAYAYAQEKAAQNP